MSALAKGGWTIGQGEFRSGREQVRSNISLRQDKSTETFGPYVLDDVGILQEPSTRSRSSKFNFPHEYNGLIGTFWPSACRHGA
jgi:hypothetical protein